MLVWLRRRLRAQSMSSELYRFHEREIQAFVKCFRQYWKHYYHPVPNCLTRLRRNNGECWASLMDGYDDASSSSVLVNVCQHCVN
mmetsp:Transcript_3646/g.7639  ORF Transcript_3646/g.7639 Transcript_3646/m.7639 type:complete len:85 (-) Transcript_3646:125-379(-)